MKWSQRRSGRFDSRWNLRKCDLFKPLVVPKTSKGDSVCNCSHLDDTFLTNNISQDLLEFLRSVPAKDLDFASDKYHDRVSRETVTNTDYDCVKAGNSTKL
ncbi:hypothetical protein BDFB_014486 [Asbolus verrucosus]|uniref:Uncharacterized protein n=1 Tax=Asbolus verrucosus TaxID=1661398 RepID=A0A482V980_ASBVE|nr:hypothetical protein BDFB_014486 [Asbolus verrucosus]